MTLEQVWRIIPGDAVLRIYAPDGFCGSTITSRIESQEWYEQYSKCEVEGIYPNWEERILEIELEVLP